MTSVGFMALAAALGTAAIYTLQPAMADVAESLNCSVGAIGLALACGPVGYLVGLALLVPLVDRFAPRLVIAWQFAALAVALTMSTFVHHAALLGIAMVAVGACSAVGASLSSTVGRLAPGARRATMLGIVTAGISVGILFGRIVGGWLTDEVGWRAMLWTFSASSLVVAALAVSILPSEAGSAQRGYLATLASIPGLVRRHATLRLAATRGALWFFAFCVVWSGLPVALSQPPFSYSAERIGLFALAGLSGILATQVAGVLVDRVGARVVILCALATAGLSAAAAAWRLDSTVATMTCLAVFDAGLFAAQVANQSEVLAIDPAAPARFNSAYMLVYFVGGSLGTAVGALVAEQVGWAAAALLAASSIALAALLTLRSPVGPSAGVGPTELREREVSHR
jgi:predicted MFS family arabinose efflux permease